MRTGKTKRYPANIFTCCRAGLPAARVGIVEAKVAALLHPVALQWATGRNEGLGTEEACLH